jgi:hypothetical protein
MGFSINRRFSDENASCVVISSEICIMLVVEPFFATFTQKDIVDATRGTEVIIGLSADSRERVDATVDDAIAAGGQPTGDAVDHGYMYGRSFQDVDGHLWEVMWMDPTAAQGYGRVRALPGALRHRR